MQEGRFEAEGWRVRKDGSLFWGNVVIDAIRDEGGNLVGFAKITRDITERRNTQLALQETEAERAHMQKMDALGQLTGGVAHDFNNLLMIVSGHLHRLRRAMTDDPKARQSAEAIETAVRRGASLTRQLLTFSRRQPSNPTVVELGPRIDSVRSMLGSSTGATVTLSTLTDPDTWPVKVDASELDLALVNLALNARDAMPEGGTIALTSENVTLAAPDTPAGIEGNFVALRLSDTGGGIPPDILSKVFDPFFTTKTSAKGSGLGLSQVYGFAHQSGGTVTIKSELGKGTTVTLYLPRAQEESAEQAAPDAQAAAAGGRVLLVEDNPEVAEATASLLEQLGYRVAQTRDAAAALEAIGAHPFDLVISDIMMPGDMDGLGLARAVRESWPDLPLMLITGYHQLAEQAGREFVLIRKPFDISDLSRATNRALNVARHGPDSNVVPLASRLRTNPK
jgi:signal transduction histidine kinase/CheY-like chemotaxis protein